MKKGFTLIELLVTIVLFSLLLITAMYSLSFVTLNIRNINNTNPTNAIFYDLLRKSISSMYPYVIFDEKEKDHRKDIYFYFDGTKNKCSYISKSPLYQDHLSLIELYFEKTKLVYEEKIIFKRGNNYKKLNNLPILKRKVLLTNLKGVEFSYKTSTTVENRLTNKLPILIKMKLLKNRSIEYYYFSIKTNNEQYKLVRPEFRDSL